MAGRGLGADTGECATGGSDVGTVGHRTDNQPAHRPQSHVSDGRSLKVVCLFDQLLPVDEQVMFMQTHEFQESCLGSFVRFQRTVFQNVRDADLRASQVAADENVPMAGNRILFAAHQRDSIRFHFFSNFFETVIEDRQLRYFAVISPALNVTLALIAPGTKLDTEKDVTDADFVKERFQCLSIVLRMEPTVGLRPHISEGTDSMPLQKGDELGQFMVGVPNRKNLFFVCRRDHQRSSITAATSL
ncbi:MAG: hypothetical protein FWD61_07455 [Phycisphaerales bacterium]|nr:hypothetical protein [Phycisphaerales bacterium]